MFAACTRRLLTSEIETDRIAHDTLDAALRRFFPRGMAVLTRDVSRLQGVCACGRVGLRAWGTKRARDGQRDGHENGKEGWAERRKVGDEREGRTDETMVVVESTMHDGE